MRQFFPVEDLARDERFVQTNMAERMKDVRAPRTKVAPDERQPRVGEEPRRVGPAHARPATTRPMPHGR